MPRSRKPSPQTRSLLTALLSDSMAWRHGYEISKLTGIRSGTLYPLLMRLHDQGLLASEWAAHDAGGRPPRHLYRLTASGLALARSNLAANAASPVPALVGVLT